MTITAIRKAVFVFGAGMLSLSLCSLTACSKKSSSQLPAALQKLTSQDTSCLCDPYIEQTVWRNQTVYLASTKGSTCLSMPMYYNADGIRIMMDSGYTYDDFAREASFVKEVWSCSGSTPIPPQQ